MIAIFVPFCLLYDKKVYEVMSRIEPNSISVFDYSRQFVVQIGDISPGRGRCDSYCCANFSIFCSLSEEFVNIFRRNCIFRCSIIGRGFNKILEKNEM